MDGTFVEEEGIAQYKRNILKMSARRARQQQVNGEEDICKDIQRRYDPLRVGPDILRQLRNKNDF